MDDIVSELDEFGIAVEADCLFEQTEKLLQQYKLGESEFCGEVIAFVRTKQLHTVTSQVLEQMEREHFSKRSYNRSKTSNTYCSDTSFLEEENALDDIMKMYGNGSAQEVKRHIEGTPKNLRFTHLKKQSAEPCISTDVSLSPSRIITKSSKYFAREGGPIVAQSFVFDESSSSTKWDQVLNKAVSSTVEIISSASSQYKCMLQKTRDIITVFDARLDHFDDINDQLESSPAVNGLEAEKVCLVGMVSRKGKDKLSADHDVLFQTISVDAAARYMLELGSLSCSVFPGQIIGVRGTASGLKIVPDIIIEGSEPCSISLPVSVKDVRRSIVVASGPFTTADTLSFSPLNELISFVKKTQPDCLVLLGPFYEQTHEAVQCGQIELTFSDYFDALLLKLSAAMKTLETTIVVVSSSRDLHQKNIYPCPAYSCRLQQVKERIHFVSDPCLVKIDQLLWGFTSTDVLFHLGAEELSTQPPSDRMSRLVSHLLHQKSFYPLYPAAVDVNIDFEQAAHYSNMPQKPHFLVLPSDLAVFAKNVNGTVCMNPGRLTKKYSGGSFGRVLLNFSGFNDSTSLSSPAPFSKCEILKI